MRRGVNPGFGPLVRGNFKIVAYGQEAIETQKDVIKGHGIGELNAKALGGTRQCRATSTQASLRCPC